MCNGYPALRCSRHAKDLLDNAQQKLGNVTTWEEQEEAQKILNQAKKAFYTTPAGFKELELLIEETTDDLEKDKLYGLLNEGKILRRNAQAEYNRIHRVNKVKIGNAKILRDSGLPWWVVASQLNVDLIEETLNVKLQNTDPKIKSRVDDDTEYDGGYIIDVRNQCFVIDVNDEKYLSINNRHSFVVYENFYRKTFGSFNKEILEITSKYADRDSNKPIEYDELLSNQKLILWDSIRNQLVHDGYTHVAVSDPRIGLSYIVGLDELEEYFTPTLYTPLVVRNGTDELSVANIADFNAVKDNQIISGEALKIKNKVLVEASKELSDSEKIVGNYILSEFKKDEHIYEIKRLGNVRGETVRVMLTLNGDKRK